MLSVEQVARIRHLFHAERGCKKNCVNGHRVKDNLNKEKRWQLTQN
jgi:hypothetical protein